MAKCDHREQFAVWDEDRGSYICEADGTALCGTCFRILAIDEEGFCDRCEDEAGMMHNERLLTR